ncbi:MAG TPA: enoyl-CoA hydratase/isomerase family protein [Bacteroidales bacterium]|nr:enoyl-CoA hydratase/isomerase family protein [Bacteroidales bacterium]
MDYSNIVSWERSGEIGVLTLSNGKENYLFTPDFVDFIKLKQWTSESDLKGIIIRGLGRNFSAGADLNQLKELSKDIKYLEGKINKGKEILDFIEDLGVPVIAAINGVCFGGGLEIALACHMRIASEKALFAFPETNHGLIPGLGGTFRLTQLIGKKALDIILNADMVNASYAFELGLVNYIHESKDSFEWAKGKLLSMVSDRPKEVVNYTMQAIRNAGRLSRVEALKIETELFCRLAIKMQSH